MENSLVAEKKVLSWKLLVRNRRKCLTSHNNWEILFRHFSSVYNRDEPQQQDGGGGADQPGEPEVRGRWSTSARHILVQGRNPLHQPDRHVDNQVNSPRFLCCCYESFLSSSFFPNDTGLYSCVRHNIAGSVSRFIDLQYLPLPGETLFITCLQPDTVIPRRQSRQLESHPHLILISLVRPHDHDPLLHSLLL